MCENCKRFGPWNTLQRFLCPKKTKKPSEELKFIRKSIEVFPDFITEWEKLKASSEAVEKLDDNTYKSMMGKFSLEVQY